ncbi:MAG TPA: type II toxin-antitoxin system HicA family toxin [Candidatus Kapabacteria bacterium]|nr:type II toxin-antitoxin system HicA family toxin [Candidatus Kapabacteria bacterium]HYM34470.1 type II toxin-antitoxin system HicA family toxin [Steroidobacteraceae bacterium]
MNVPVLGAKEVLSALRRLGFQEVHRRGSHVKLTHADGRVIIIPFHNPVDRYTLKGALKDADIDIQDFLNAL